MISTDYCIDALEILLDRDCVSERYYALIPYKRELLARFHRLGCRTKNDTAALSDEAIGLANPSLTRLLRRFLGLYDPNPQKFRELAKLGLQPEKAAAFRELYHLPGVKAVRAELYYRAGFRSLRDFANAAPEDILTAAVQVIAQEKLSCIAPLPKEVRTQIAVSKAFLWEK